MVGVTVTLQANYSNSWSYSKSLVYSYSHSTVTDNKDAYMLAFKPAFAGWQEYQININSIYKTSFP